MQAPPPPSGPLIFNHSYNDDYLPLRYPEAYAKLPTKMIKKICDLRRRVEDGTASEGFA